MHIEISLCAKFQLKITILIFWTIFAKKRYFWSKREKNEHHHSMMDIHISLCAKFQLKITMLIFCTKFAQKWYFWSKGEKISSTIEFYIFKLVYVRKFSLK